MHKPNSIFILADDLGIVDIDFYHIKVAIELVIAKLEINSDVLFFGKAFYEI